jgi:hypothetical protein
MKEFWVVKPCRIISVYRRFEGECCPTFRVTGIKTAGAYDYNPLPSSADITESGSLNLPEPFGPHKPVMGII